MESQGTYYNLMCPVCKEMNHHVSPPKDLPIIFKSPTDFITFTRKCFNCNEVLVCEMDSAWRIRATPLRYHPNPPGDMGEIQK